MDPLLFQGVLALFLFVLVFIGSTWLLLAMILGPRMGYWVTGATLFGIMVILSILWAVTALGPKGPETTWHPVAIGPNLESAEARGDTYDFSGYPDGGWQTPGKGKQLAGLKGEADTAAEVNNLTPVLEAFVSHAVHEIPGKREEVAHSVQGSLELKPGEFELTNVRMKETEVEGKQSILGMATVVPSGKIRAESLGPDPNLKDGEVAAWLVKPNDTVTAGQEVLAVSTEAGEVRVPSTHSGKVLSLGLAEGDRVTVGVPIATLDLSGQAGVPAAAQVAAARVIGSARRPAIYYLVVSTVLFIIHLSGLARAERSANAVPQPA